MEKEFGSEKKLKVEISKMLSLSTGHISPEDVENLQNGSMPFPSYLKEDPDGNVVGWFVYLNGGLKDPKIPDSLRACGEFARSIGCDIICFDPDVEPVDDLPVYEWN